MLQTHLWKNSAPTEWGTSDHNKHEKTKELGGDCLRIKLSQVGASALVPLMINTGFLHLLLYQFHTEWKMARYNTIIIPDQYQYTLQYWFGIEGFN